MVSQLSRFEHPWRRLSPLQLLLLVQLEGSPKYGYEMLKAIKDEFEGVWEPKTGTVYPALKSMEKRGLVSTHQKDGVDFYHITSKGRSLLRIIGSHEEYALKFSSRFLKTLIKWMPDDLKQLLFKSITSLSPGDVDFSSTISLLDGNVDDETRLKVLESMRIMLLKRLDVVDKLTAEIGGGGA
jgi:DNA-binding PadR family transcriptional regulator